MKMEHVVTADSDGVVAAVHVAKDDNVAAGASLVSLTPLDQSPLSADPASTSATKPQNVGGEATGVRPELAEVVARHEVGLDQNRPDAVARRRKTGQRTARENVYDLIDE